MLKKFLSLPNHSLGACIKGKRINRRVGYRLEIPVEDIFYDNEKAIQWAKRTLDGVDGNIKKKVKRFKINQLFPTCVLFFFGLSTIGR